VYVAEVQEKERREQVALRRYGNQCIEECAQVREASEFLERLTTIADLYVQGHRLEFERLYSGVPCARVSLPTYPFATQRFWLQKADAEEPEIARTAPPVNVAKAQWTQLIRDVAEQKVQIGFAVDKAKELLNSLGT
jgi:acyl transferase domain-containing protein